MFAGLSLAGSTDHGLGAGGKARATSTVERAYPPKPTLIRPGAPAAVRW